MLHGAHKTRIKGCNTMSDVGCGKCSRLVLWDVPLYNEGGLDDWRLTVTSVTWVLVENLLGGRAVT